MYDIHGVGNLVVFDEHLNESSYIDLTDRNLLEPVEQMFRDQQHSLVFQSDNALCHRAMAVFAWFKNIDRRKMLCPVQSPDVNTI